MARIVYIFPIVLIIIHGKALGIAVCPLSNGEASNILQNCVDRNGLGQTTMLTYNGEYKERCTDGSVDRAVQCMEEAVHICRHKHNLTDIMNRWQNLFRVVCENIQVLIDGDDCIKHQQSEVTHCVQKAAALVQGNLQGLSSSSAEEKTQQACRMYDEMHKCSHTIYTNACGQQIADILTIFGTPIVCDNPSTTTTQQPISTASSSKSGGSAAAASLVCSCNLRTNPIVLP